MVRDGSEKRAHPRVGMLARVQVTRDSEVHILSTLNISQGGMFIQADPRLYPDLAVGAEVDLVVLNPNDPDDDALSIRAMVIRAQLAPRAGFGLLFTSVGPTAKARLDLLLAAKKSPPPLPH